MVTLNLERQNDTLVRNPHELNTNSEKSEVLVITIPENQITRKAAINSSPAIHVIRDPHLVQALLDISNGSFDESSMDVKENTTPSKEINPRKEKINCELSNREEEVLELIAEGCSNKAIAETLFISGNTVKTHLRSIMHKLDVANRSQAAVYATKMKLAKVH